MTCLLTPDLRVPVLRHAQPAWRKRGNGTSPIRLVLTWKIGWFVRRVCEGVKPAWARVQAVEELLQVPG